MKVEVSTPDKGPKYPWVGRRNNTGKVVLFFEPRTGIILAPGTTGERAGAYLERIIEEHYTPCSVTITNE